MLIEHRGQRPVVPESAYVGCESVRIVPLDSVIRSALRPQDVAWLKLDVQGYEMPVLEGARRTLRSRSTRPSRARLSRRAGR